MAEATPISSGAAGQPSVNQTDSTEADALDTDAIRADLDPAGPTGSTGGTSRRRRRSSRLDVTHGSAKMRGYIVTSAELWGLGGLGLLASLAFSIGASCITFSVDTAQAIDLSPGVDVAKAAYWSAAGHFAKYAGIGLVILGMVAVASGSLYIRHILRRTKFAED